jgi:hypothetical protein
LHSSAGMPPASVAVAVLGPGTVGRVFLSQLAQQASRIDDTLSCSVLILAAVMSDPGPCDHATGKCVCFGAPQFEKDAATQHRHRPGALARQVERPGDCPCKHHCIHSTVSTSWAPVPYPQSHVLLPFFMQSAFCGVCPYEPLSCLPIPHARMFFASCSLKTLSTSMHSKTGMACADALAQ